jgi:hypothetical protein
VLGCVADFGSFYNATLDWDKQTRRAQYVDSPEIAVQRVRDHPVWYMDDGKVVWVTIAESKGCK